MSKRPSKNPSGGRRAKRLSLPIGSRTELVVSLRWFRTDKNKRSKLKKQYVFPVYFLPVKELSITRVRHRLSRQGRTLLGLQPSGLFLVSLGLIGAIYFGLQLTSYARLDPVSATPIKVSNIQAKPESPTALKRSEPTRLRINKVEIDASVVPSGLKADGSIRVPSSDVVGWYDQGPTPGEKGPAVIVGHVDNLTGPAVFWRLREMLPGDIIEIDRADHTTTKFKVEQVQQFAQDNFPTQEIYGQINYAGLRLITCGGEFNPKTGHYSHNTVVFASLTN